MIVLIILSPLLLIAAGFVWGVIWISAVHAIFYFFFLAPVVDIIVYRYVGIRLHRTLSTSSLNRTVQFGLAALNIAMFFIGNRVILFGWVLGVWPWKDSDIDWILVSMDVLSLGIGLAIATGLYQPNHDHQTHPNKT